MVRSIRHRDLWNSYHRKIHCIFLWNLKIIEVFANEFPVCRIYLIFGDVSEPTNVPQVSSICRWLFNRPVDWSRSISTVDTITLTTEYGRYRQSIRLHSQQNTVDIDGRSDYTHWTIRSILTVDRITLPEEYGRYRQSIRIHRRKKSVDIDRRLGLI